MTSEKIEKLNDLLDDLRCSFLVEENHKKMAEKLDEFMKLLRDALPVVMIYDGKKGEVIGKVSKQKTFLKIVGNDSRSLNFSYSNDPRASTLDKTFDLGYVYEFKSISEWFSTSPITYKADLKKYISYTYSLKNNELVSINIIEK